jgi:SRSO17 transposase
MVRFGIVSIRCFLRVGKMGEAEGGIEGRFEAYVAELTSVFGHADRALPFHDYCSGLLLPGERKSVEPMAALVAPSRVSAKHQSLLHFVGQASWSDMAVLAKVRDLVLPSLEPNGGIKAWIIDDTSFAKKGEHSVGVARQYCGRLGKQDNCQVAVTLSVANHAASLPIAYRLYLPESWASDPIRRAKTGVPDEVRFQTKPQIALDQIHAALADGIAPGVVLADAAYGYSGELRAALAGQGSGPEPACGVRIPHLARLARGIEGRPHLALCQLSRSCGRSRLQEGDVPAPRMAARDWPQNEAEPTKYWLSSLPENIKLASLVDWAKLRWRIERDYEELKSELGLAHFEGRGWRGFHHHHRRLWLPHPRTSGLSPLRRQNPPNTCHSQPSKTHRRPRYALSDTSRTPSPQTVSTSSSQSLIASLDVPAARDASIFESNDAVELAACSGASAEFVAQIISRRCLRRGGGKVASSSLRSA